MSEEKTIFQKIIDKEIPSTTHYEDDLCIVIEDINPKAPIHLLIIPKKPIPKLSDASEEDVSILGHLMFIVGEMSRKFETEVCKLQAGTKRRELEWSYQIKFCQK